MKPLTLLLIQLTTAMPFFLIQLRVVYKMIRQYKTFDNPFFKLLLLNNIAYLILWLLIHVGQYNFPIYQRLFVEFKEPDEYVIWTTFLPVAYAICIVVPMLCFADQLFTKARHALNNNSVIPFYYLDVSASPEATLWHIDRYLVVLFELSIVVLCFSANIITILFVYCSGTMVALRQNGAFSANLLAISFFDLTIHSLWLFFDLALYLDRFHGYSNLFFWVQIVYLFADNFDSIILGTVLILTNKAIRKAAVFDLFKLGNPAPTSAVIVFLGANTQRAQTSLRTRAQNTVA